MDKSQAIIIFIFESLFLIGTLCICLRFAALRHKAHLTKLIQQINKTALHKTDLSAKFSNQELRDRLMAKIRKLQNQVRALQIIEKRYHTLLEQTENAKSPAGRSKKFSIEAGSTVDRESGVAQNYLDYLSKKDIVQGSLQSTGRIDHHARAVNSKLEQQRQVIKKLEQQLKDSLQRINIAELKEENYNKATKTIEELEITLSQSQRISEKLESELSRVNEDFRKASEKLQAMENQTPFRAEGVENKEYQGSFNIITRQYFAAENEGHLDEYEKNAIQNYQVLRGEVENLRENLTVQRRLIFTLEAKVIDLKNELNKSGPSDGDDPIKQEAIQDLERILKETEGCVEVLESEVNYLQGKILKLTDNYEKSDEVIDQQSRTGNTLEDDASGLKRALDTSNKRLKRALLIRESIAKFIESASKETGIHALQYLAAMILNMLEPLGIEVHLKVCTSLGEIETSNTPKTDKRKIALISNALSNKLQGVQDTGNGFTIVYSHAGAYIERSDGKEGAIGSVHDTVSFVLLVANTMTVNIEERNTNESQKLALKKLVEGVKTNLNNVVIQTRYQSDEVRKIHKSFCNEFSEYLNTMKMTDNQSRIFSEMIQAVQQRLEILLASDVVIDSSFSKLMDKLEKGSGYLK